VHAIEAWIKLVLVALFAVLQTQDALAASLPKWAAFLCDHWQWFRLCPFWHDYTSFEIVILIKVYAIVSEETSGVAISILTLASRFINNL